MSLLSILYRTFFLAPLLIALPAWASDRSPLDEARALEETALGDPWAYAFLERLTTQVGPRLAGTPAMARALDFAQGELKQLSLDEVHRESFAMTAWVRGPESAEVMEPAPQRLVLAALGGSVATPPRGLEALITVFPRYADLLAAAPGSLKGRIAVVTEPMARAADGAGYRTGSPMRRAGPSEAAKRGAIGYLLRSLGTDGQRLAHAGALNYGPDAPKIPAAALAAPDAEQLTRLAASGPVRIRLILRPREDTRAQSANIVGEIKGRERAGEIVLIGAHLDSWDLGTGAVDDGIGLAIVSGAMRLIAQMPVRPRRTLRVVLFGAEEMDISGPAYAAAHAAEASHIVLAAESDFGIGPVEIGMLPKGAAGTQFSHDVGRALRHIDAKLDDVPAPFGGSDIAGLQKQGVPVALLRQNGITYFDVHHTADDTFDKVDAQALRQCVAAWAAFAYLAAESDQLAAPAKP
jgi:Peptidase family M28